MAQAILYTNSNCHACEKAKVWLKESGIDFKEINIEEDDKTAQKLAQMGLLSVPVLKLSNGDMILGFTPMRYTQAFLELKEEVAG